MNEKPDYDFYFNYGGTVRQETFEGMLNKATAIVENMIGGKDASDCSDQYKAAVCAAVDALATYGTSTVTGFSLGSFSVSGANASGAEIARSDAARELEGTGLLYGGLPC